MLLVERKSNSTPCLVVTVVVVIVVRPKTAADAVSNQFYTLKGKHNQTLKSRLGSFII